jgi:hypothetical protein
MTPTPTRPANLTFSRPDGGSGSKQDHEPFSRAQWGWSESGENGGAVWAGATINLGSFEHPRASAYIYNSFRAASSSAVISGDLVWRGRFIQAGVLGTRAASSVVLEVRDSNGRVIAREVVHEREVGEALISGGTVTANGSRAVALNVALTPGATYQIRLTLTCEAESGLLAAATSCAYIDTDIPGGVADGYVAWRRLEVLWN